MYAEAYAAHYKQKDFRLAYNLYLEVIDTHPASSECKYAKTQIENLKKSSPDCCVPNEENRDIAAKHDAAVAEAEAAEQEKYAADRYSAELREQKKLEIEKHISEMMYSTCSSLEGYRITKHLGLVYGEVLFKANFMDRFIADIKNIGDFLKLSDTEMSGSMDILSAGREHAIKKMTRSAAEKGANAIVGIDSESSYAGAITHITMMGTAVFVEKIEE